MLAQVSVIAFDLDDTLWPCMPTINRAEEALYRWLQRHYPRITDSCEPTRMIELRREFSARQPHYAVDMSVMRQDFLYYLAELHDYDAAWVAKTGFDVFFNARQQVDFYADVLPCLQRLKQRYRLGSISNGNACVEQVGLGHLIEHAVSAADLQIAKPDPLIYQHLATRFETAPERMIYVGDHPRYDVLGASEAGYQAVWMNREAMIWPQDVPQPRYQVVDLHELEALLSV